MMVPESIFAYNPDGRLLEATNAEATVQMKYNGSGNLIEEIQNGHSVKSNYNRLGNRTKITSSLGANILQEFDTKRTIIPYRGTKFTSRKAKHSRFQCRWWQYMASHF